MDHNITKAFFEKKQAEHTKMKLLMLKLYVIPWMRKVILNKYGNKSCFIVDTFAGVGKYSDGSIGSPLILVNEAIDFIKQGEEQNLKIGKILLAFIEKDESNYLKLKENIEEIVGQPLIDNEFTNCKKYSKLSIAIVNNTHNEFLEDLIENVNNIIPSIFFMDPFGFNLPFEINQKILNKYKNVEFLINFMYEEINRFINVDKVKKNMEIFFGLEDISLITEKLKDADSKKREEIIKGAYCRKLENSGAKKTLSFDIYSERGQLKMTMIFATKNIEGFDTMKDVLDKLSNTDNFEYNPRIVSNPDQMMIEGFEEKRETKNIREMAYYLYEHCKKKEVPVSALKVIAKEHQRLPSKYLKRSLLFLKDDNKIKRVYRENGMEVRNRTFPDDSIVEFL